MRVLHGEVYDVFGEIKSRGEYGYVNAKVKLSGRSSWLEFKLEEFPDLGHVIGKITHQVPDAIWVIGRIKALFGNWIELNEGEKSILTEGFAAYCKKDDLWIPFVLTDYYLRTCFMFGDTGYAKPNNDPLKREIARNFYELLLESPDELVDFDFRKDHIGAGVTMVGGIAHGQVQYDEEP